MTDVCEQKASSPHPDHLPHSSKSSAAGLAPALLSSSLPTTFSSIHDYYKLKLRKFSEDITPANRPTGATISSSNHKNFIVVPRSYVHKRIYEEVCSISDLLCISVDTAFTFFRHYGFNARRATDAYIANKEEAISTAGLNNLVIVPNSLLGPLSSEAKSVVSLQIEALQTLNVNTTLDSNSPDTTVSDISSLPYHLMGAEGYSFGNEDGEVYDDSGDVDRNGGNVLLAQCCSAYCSAVPLGNGAFLSCGHFFCDMCWSNYFQTIFAECFSALGSACMGLTCDGLGVEGKERTEHACSGQCKCHGALPFSLFLRYIDPTEVATDLGLRNWNDPPPSPAICAPMADGVWRLPLATLDLSMSLMIDRYVQMNKSVRWCPSPTCSMGAALARASSGSLIPSSYFSYNVATAALKKPPTFGFSTEALGDKSVLSFWIQSCPLPSASRIDSAALGSVSGSTSAGNWSRTPSSSTFSSTSSSTTSVPGGRFGVAKESADRCGVLFCESNRALFSSTKIESDDLHSPLYLVESVPGACTGPVECLCGYSFCFLCEESSHFPLPCDLFKLWIRGTALDEDEDAALSISAHCKNCPKCKIPISKDRHCNHMTCGMCRYEFCWICLESFRSTMIGTNTHYECNKLSSGNASKQTMEVESNRIKSNELIIKHNVYYTRFAQHWINSIMLRNMLYLLETRLRQITPNMARLLDLQERYISSIPSNQDAIDGSLSYDYDPNGSGTKAAGIVTQQKVAAKFLVHMFPPNSSLTLSMLNDPTLTFNRLQLFIKSSPSLTLNAQKERELMDRVATEERRLGHSLSPDGIYGNNSFSYDVSKYSFLGTCIRNLIDNERLLQWTYAIMFYLHTIGGSENLRRKQLLEMQVDMLSKQLALAREYIFDLETCFSRASLQEKTTKQIVGDTTKTCADIIGQVSQGAFDSMIQNKADSSFTTDYWTCLSCMIEMPHHVRKCVKCTACKSHSEIECFICRNSSYGNIAF